MWCACVNVISNECTICAEGVFRKRYRRFDLKSPTRRFVATGFRINNTISIMFLFAECRGAWSPSPRLPPTRWPRPADPPCEGCPGSSGSTAAGPPLASYRCPPPIVGAHGACLVCPGTCACVRAWLDVPCAPCAVAGVCMLLRACAPDRVPKVPRQLKEVRPR